MSRLNIRASRATPLRFVSIRAAWLLALLGALTASWASPVSAASPKRPLPDYEGRRPPPTTAGDVLLWVPRVLLFPTYLVAEYLIRKPLGFVISTAEREEVPRWLYDFFTFGSEHQAGIVPTGYVDFDFYPSIGLYSFWNDAFFPGHDLRPRAAFDGSDWLTASFSERSISPAPSAGGLPWRRRSSAVRTLRSSESAQIRDSQRWCATVWKGASCGPRSSSNCGERARFVRW